MMEVLFLEPMSDVLVMINSGDINAAKKELQASIFGTLVAIHMECAENKMSLDEKERKLVLSIFEKASNSTSGFIPIDDPVMALLRDPESCFSQ